MSEEEKKPESADAPPPTEEPNSHPAAELEELIEDQEEVGSEPPAPRLKALLQSDDAPSRYLSILALLFGFLALVCLGLLVFQYLKYRHSVQKSEAVAVVAPIEHNFTERLGEMKVNWGNAELKVDIVVNCSSESACESIKARINEARDITSGILQGSSRDEILNPDRKLLIRRKIAESLSEMKLGGKITSVDFSDMTVEISHVHSQ